MKDFKDEQIDQALAKLGNYRVRRTQVAARETSDDISGALILAMGLREAQLSNVESGIRKDIKTSRWVEENSPEFMVVGVFQISREHHAFALSRMTAVRRYTWGPVVMGKTPLDVGFVPRFEESLEFVLSELHETMGTMDEVIEPKDLLRAAIAAYSSGVENALKGYREGDVDRYTAGGDFSAWVLRHRTHINKWLSRHPDWQVPA